MSAKNFDLLHLCSIIYSMLIYKINTTVTNKIENRTSIYLNVVKNINQKNLNTNFSM